MQKRCKITRCVYNPLLSLWDRQSSNTLFCKGFFSSVIRGEQNLKANVHKEFRFTSSQSDRRGLSRLCTKTPSFPQSFVQEGILHKKSRYQERRAQKPTGMRKRVAAPGM